MKKILLLIVILALFALPAFADSIKPVKLVDGANETVLDETNNLVKTGLYTATGNVVDLSNPLSVALSDGVDQLDIDDGVIPTEDKVHYEIHEGDAYEIARLAIDVGDDLSASLYLTIAAGYEGHVVFSGSSEGKAYSYLYKDPNYVAAVNGGTAITPTNKKLGSANTSKVTAKLNPNITQSGTLLFSGYIPGDVGPKTVGSQSSVRDEWVFTANDPLYALIWNKGAAAKDAAMVALWYEEEE